ncbi:MAG: hypothetical protein HY716_09400 [Planctomycetes bacterium]|nr:hypothetical protein [Planctomycetota bacterium]
MKWILVLGLAWAAAGCVAEGNWRNVESAVHELEVPPEGYTYMVSPVLRHDQMSDYIQRREAQGWDVAHVAAAGEAFPDGYILTFRRPR